MPPTRHAHQQSPTILIAQGSTSETHTSNPRATATHNHSPWHSSLLLRSKNVPLQADIDKSTDSLRLPRKTMPKEATDRTIPHACYATRARTSSKCTFRHTYLPPGCSLASGVPLLRETRTPCPHATPPTNNAAACLGHACDAPATRPVPATQRARPQCVHVGLSRVHSCLNNRT